MQHLFLGLDIGTSSVKGVICDQTGKIIKQAEAPNELLSLHIGWAEQDLQRWKQNVIQVTQNCLDEEINAHNIDAIGVSGMVPALVLLDKNGEVLRQAIQYNDSRSIKEIRQYENKIGSGKFFKISGASLSVQSIGPKLAWIRQWEPSIWDQICHVMGSYDYINFLLTGEISVERNWALESGLYDINLQSWSKELIDEFEIPDRILPSIHAPFDLIGTVRPQIAKMTGLISGTPVTAGSADHVAAALAAGITQTGDVLIKFGSSGDILYCSEQPILDPRLYIDYHNLPGKYLPNGCMATSGSLLKWFVNEFCQQDVIEAGSHGLTVYEYLDNQALKIAPGSNGINVLPYFLGAKTPLNNPDARGVFHGMTLSHNRFHLYRAVMEAVIYGFRDHFEVLQQLDLPVRRVVASEGGAKSSLWRQMAADILNTPIEYLHNNPGSAFGAALVAGMAVHQIHVDTITQIHAPKDTAFPNEKNRQQYDSSYRTYQELYEQINEIY